MQNLSYGNEFDLQANKRARNIISTTMAVQQHSFKKQRYKCKASTEIACCNISVVRIRRKTKLP